VAIQHLVTRGYGTFGDVNLLPTRGYGPFAEQAVHGVVVRRWHGRILWQEQDEWDREREAEVATVAKELESLIDQRALLREELRKAPALPSLRKVQAQLQRRLQAFNRDVERARERLAREREKIEQIRRVQEEDMRVIAMVLEEFDFYDD
jgi:hypothetical protein